MQFLLFKNVIDGKETFFGPKKFNLSNTQKAHFSKGVKIHAFGQTMFFFLQLFSVKTRLEIMFNTLLETKETFFSHKKFSLSKSQKSHFPKGVNPCLSSKNVFFFLELFSVKIRLEIMFKTL